MEKWVLITGGTKGIGRAVAECLAKSGYQLVLTFASDVEAAERARTELASHYGVEVHALQADNADITMSVELINRHLEERQLYLDAIIMNAGQTCRDAFEEIRWEDWERVFRANVHFPVFLLQRVVGRIRKGGSVVFTGSLMGIEPHSVSLAYGVTKNAVHSLVRQWRRAGFRRYGMAKDEAGRNPPEHRAEGRPRSFLRA